VSTNRLEAFSDGVIAVAVTLLVLDIAVPQPGGSHSLGHALAQQWPNYAAYAISFITIGIIWINHHVMIGRLREADHSILMLNLVLLMTIAVLPFATSLMARYLREGAGEHLAAAVYAGAFLALAIAFIALQRQILLRRPRLLERELPEAERRRIVRRTATGIVPYALALALAPVSPYVTLGICGAVACFYALPSASSA
jgi:uncharacterized membrane protein